MGMDYCEEHDRTFDRDYTDCLDCEDKEAEREDRDLETAASRLST